MSTQGLILTLSCPDRRGIVAAVSAFLAGRDCNILDAQQYDDAETGVFFMRVVFRPDGHDAAGLRGEFGPVADAFAMTWSLRDPAVRKKVMILASRSDHCLADLLYRWRIGELPMDIAGVISNHPAATYPHVDLSDLPFHCLPVTKDTKLEQEAQVWALIRDSGAATWWSSPATCRCCPTAWRPSWRAVASTSTIPSCRASRGPGPITRPMPAG